MYSLIVVRNIFVYMDIYIYICKINTYIKKPNGRKLYIQL